MAISVSPFTVCYIFCLFSFIILFEKHDWKLNRLRSGDSSMVRAPDLLSKGHRFESRQEQRENFLLQGHLSVLSLYFGIRSTSKLPQYSVTSVAHERSLSFLPKGQVAAKQMYASYICGFGWSDTTWCMVTWCTQNLFWDGSSFLWLQPCNSQRVLDITKYKLLSIPLQRMFKMCY